MYISYAGIYYHRNALLYDVFNRIDKLMDRNEVIHIMGNPDKETECDENLWWDDKFIDKNENMCKSQFWYYGCNPRSRIWVPSCVDSWTIGFNSDGKVIAKYHYSSR
jgi:hypothetical protein